MGCLIRLPKPGVGALLLLALSIQAAGAQVADTNSETSDALLQRAVEQADAIEDEKIRLAAQWKLVRPLIRSKWHDRAFDQAMKLQSGNPHTCMLSLSTIALDAAEREDFEREQRAFATAVSVNEQAKWMYTHIIVKMGFKLGRPLNSLIELAKKAPSGRRDFAFADIRDWLARTDRVDEAYEVARTYLPRQSESTRHRTIGYSTSTVKHYDYDAKHDYFGQTIDVINRMQPGEDRDYVILSLVNNLTYVTGKDRVSEEHLRLATEWAEKIDNEARRGQARRKVIQRKDSETVDELEKRIVEVELREEKSELLERLFQKLLSEERLEEAEKILPRKLAIIDEQPREKQVSAFGSYDDSDARNDALLNHERGMAGALIKFGRLDEAKKRVDALERLPESRPRFLAMTPGSLRQSLLIRLGEYEELKKLIEQQFPGEPERYPMMMASHFLENGELDRALEQFEQVAGLPQERVFPPKKINHFSATLHQGIAEKLIQQKRFDEAIRALSPIPEHERLVTPFEDFGRKLAKTEGLTIEDLLMWIDRLPHPTARLYATIGAWESLSAK